jgi:hypothetical protein
MLQCNMTNSLGIQLGLEDLLADLHHARRNGELGRLALLAYCEVRGWARQAGKPDIADSATQMFTENPCVSKVEFLVKVDRLIATLELHQQEYPRLGSPLSPRFAAAASEAAQTA